MSAQARAPRSRRSGTGTWYRALVDDSPTGQLAIGLDGTVLVANRCTRELCGLDHVPVAKHLTDFIVPSQRTAIQEQFAAAKAGKTPRFESELLRVDGSAVTVGITLYPVRRDGEIVAVGARVHDRTHLREADQRRAENQQSLRLRQLYLVAASAGRTPQQQVQATLDLGMQLLRCDAGVLSEFEGEKLVVRFKAGGGGSEVGLRLLLSESHIRHALGQHEVTAIDDLAAPPWSGDHAGCGRTWTAFIGAPVERFGTTYGAIAFMTREPGGCCFRESDKDLVRLMGALSGSALERLAHEERLGALAFYDGLTGLANRVLFDDRVAQTLVAARRHQQKLAIMYIDLDDFKKVNDRHGHAAGDEVLRVAARRIAAIVRESDTVARQGGDEFVLLQRFVHSAQDATDLALRINEAVRQPIAVDGAIIVVSASIGIALYPEDGTLSQELLVHADAALYEAKNAGRDQAVLFVTPARATIVSK